MYIKYIVLLSVFITLIGASCRGAADRQLTDAAQKNIVNLMFLPDEIIAHIAGFLSPQFLMQMVLMSVRLNRIIKDTRLYKILKKHNGNLQEAFFNTIRADEQDAIGYLVRHGADINAMDKDGWIMLKFGALHGSNALVTELLNNRANVDEPDINGETALIMVANWQITDHNKEIINLLLEANANVNATTRYGRTALSSAAFTRHGELIAPLIQAKANVNAAFRAIINSRYDKEGAQRLLLYGAYISNPSEAQKKQMRTWGISQKKDVSLKQEEL